MKTTKILVLSFSALLTISGCSPENDIKNPDLIPFALYEPFSANTQDGDVLDLAGWTNYAEAGVVKWKEGVYYSDKYAEFSAYQSGQQLNIGWLISPAIDMANFPSGKLAFDVAQAYVESRSNSLEVLVSTDFDGTNVELATWESKTFNLPPLGDSTNFDFFSSGPIDLSEYVGEIYIAFKVKGGDDDPGLLDGTYELDNIRIYNKK